MAPTTIPIVPIPKEFNTGQGCCKLNKGDPISISLKDKKELLPIAQKLQSIIKDTLGLELALFINNNKSQNQGIYLRPNKDLPDEGYCLKITEQTIDIAYGDFAGAFHAVGTLKQILVQSDRQIPCLEIRDYPDFKARGIMLDISRNKIPKMETLYRIVDLMADIRLNQLQLYIEGFPFAYRSFPQVWEDQTPITGEEIMLLDKYCADRFIELVPNQNSFGHMTPWLARTEFKDLAECPDGCQAPWGWYDKPLSLNPLDPESLDFISLMYDDLLPYFSSALFNAGCDETFELGQGKSRELCERVGTGRVYFDFLMKIYRSVKTRGKKMMFWGDILLHYPELVPRLPKDIIVLNWGYGDKAPKLESCKVFMDSGIPYYVCPGTNCWNTIAGSTEKSKKNLLNAAKFGKECGAIGYLNTDWGDGGHWHFLPVSYAAYVYGAALSWGVEQNEDIDVSEYLNKFVFLDKHNKMGAFALDLGNYGLREFKTGYDGTGVFRTLQTSQLTDTNTDLDFLNLPEITKEEFENVREYVIMLASELDLTALQCEDADIVYMEFKNAIRLVRHGTELGLFKLSKRGGEREKEQLEKLLEDLSSIMEEYMEVWLKRNRRGGLDASLSKMQELKRQYIDYIDLLKTGTLKQNSLESRQ